MTASVVTAPDTVPRPGLAERFDRHAGRLMVLPAVIVLLCFAIFPLIISAYLALSRFALAPGGFTLKFVGLFNFKKLLTGSQQYHLLGTFGPFGACRSGSSLRRRRSADPVPSRPLPRSPAAPPIFGTIGRLITASLAMALIVLLIATLVAGGVPGTMVTTLIYVGAGVTAQFLLGLGLALLCAQAIRGRNFFRVLFFVPLMVTPVGIAYTFRMLADMQKGPFAPLLQSLRRRRMVVGDRGVVGAADGAGRRHLAVDAIHVHRPPRRDREPAARPGRGGAYRRRQRPADLPRHHLAGDRAGRGDHRPHPAHRGVQDHRPARTCSPAAAPASPPS